MYYIQYKYTHRRSKPSKGNKPEGVPDSHFSQEKILYTPYEFDPINFMALKNDCLEITGSKNINCELYKFKCLTFRHYSLLFRNKKCALINPMCNSIFIRILYSR